MITTNDSYERTQEKLANLRNMIARIERAPAASTSARALSLRSLRAFANQLAEEIVRYQTDHQLPASSIRELVGSAHN